MEKGSLIKLIETVKPLAQILLIIAQRFDPKVQEIIRRRRALTWAEKYIFANEELRMVLCGDKLTKKLKRRKAKLERMLKYYRKWFFQNS